MATPDRQRGPRRRRETPTKGDLRERAILDAAEALLARDGVEPLTVEAIARGAGISRGSLYFYFGSRQEVLTALVARTVDVLAQDALAAAAALDAPPLETVRESLRRTERSWREHGPVLRAAVDHAAAIPEIGVLWNDTVVDYATVMTAVLRRAGLPDGSGATGAAALARALCWMTERTYYVASSAPDGRQGLRAATATCGEIWARVIASA